MIEQQSTRESGARPRDMREAVLEADALRAEDPGPARDHTWRRRYALRLMLTDLVVLLWVVFGVQIAWFGLETSDVRFDGDVQGLTLSYTTLSVIIIASWMAVLGIYGTRSYRSTASSWTPRSASSGSSPSSRSSSASSSPAATS
jgi:hypothetical protein